MYNVLTSFKHLFASFTAQFVLIDEKATFVAGQSMSITVERRSVSTMSYYSVNASDAGEQNGTLGDCSRVVFPVMSSNSSLISRFAAQNKSDL